MKGKERIVSRVLL